MTLNDIKQTIEKGGRVYHQSPSYEVIKDRIGQYLIKCHLNDYCIGLTWQDGKTLNGREYEFYRG